MALGYSASGSLAQQATSTASTSANTVFAFSSPGTSPDQSATFTNTFENPNSAVAADGGSASATPIIGGAPGIAGGSSSTILIIIGLVAAFLYFKK